MAKLYIPPHILPYNCDLDIPPIERWSLTPFTLSPDGLLTPSMIEDSRSDTGFQDRVIKGDASSTVSLDHLYLKS